MTDMIIEINTNPEATAKFKKNPNSSAREFGLNSLEIESTLDQQTESSNKNVKGLMLTIHS